jgi:hypothetical protein
VKAGKTPGGTFATGNGNFSVETPGKSKNESSNKKGFAMQMRV